MQSFGPSMKFVGGRTEFVHGAKVDHFAKGGKRNREVAFGAQRSLLGHFHGVGDVCNIILQR